MTKIFHVFISSKMVELAAERQLLQNLLPQLGNEFIDLRAWVFEEDAPASNQSIREVYLDALKASALYIGLFWNDYGEWTIDEFKKASEWGIDRHIYVKNVDPQKRDPRLSAFLEAQSDVVSGITPKWFETADDLHQQLTKSVQVWLQDHLQRRPGDSSAIFAEYSDDIPELPKKLIGREQLVAAILALMADGGDVLLQGFGGMGKTAVAAQLAADWLDDERGNVVWLRAGSEDANTMLEAIAHPFNGQAEVASAEGREKNKVIRRILQENQITLIVLDDVWDGNALNEVLRVIPRQTSVLVTARQRYALDDIVEVGRLAENAALELLSYYARQDYTTSNDAKELCRQLGYHAFALEVAGKTLKVDRIQPSDLLKRIASTPHDIAMPQDFAEEGRSSIRELMDASLYALNDRERHIFLAFGGLFAPTATPDLLAGIENMALVDVQEALVTLQRRGLVERHDDPLYYTVHNLAYSYAKTIVSSHGRAPQTHLALMAEFVEAHANDLPILDAMRSNWLGAAQLAQLGNNGDVLIRLMHALVYDYLSAHGHTLPFLQLVEAAIEAAAQLGPEYDNIRADLIGKQGNIYLQRGDIQRALMCYQVDLDLARELAQPHRQVLLLSVIGALRGDAEGEHYLNEAYALANTLDDHFLRGFVLEKLAYHAQAKGDYEATRQYSTEQVSIAKVMGDRTTQVFALLNLGKAENDLRNSEQALAYHQEALQIARQEQNIIWEGYSLQNIGEDYYHMGKADEARRHLLAALEIFRERGLQSQINEIEILLTQLS